MLAVAIGIFDEVEAFTTPLPNTHLDNSPAKSLPITLLGHPRKQEIIPFLSLKCSDTVVATGAKPERRKDALG